MSAHIGSPICNPPHKRPESVLVVLYSPCGRILLLERADRPGFWQSVTGSLEADELPAHTAIREVNEETGLILNPDDLQDWHKTNTYEIYAHWRHRYAPGVTRNTEHVFSACIAENSIIHLSAREHVRWGWYDLDAAVTIVFSPSNAEAIRCLPQRGCIAPIQTEHTP